MNPYLYLLSCILFLFYKYTYFSSLFHCIFDHFLQTTIFAPLYYALLPRTFTLQFSPLSSTSYVSNVITKDVSIEGSSGNLNIID